MSSFTKALNLLDSLSSELRALAKDYSNPQLAAFLKAIGGSTRKSAARSVSGGTSTALPDDINAKLFHEAKALADKEEISTANALKKAAGVPMNVAVAILAGKPTKLRSKTVRKLAAWCKFVIPADVPSDGATVITPPSGAKRRGKKK